MKTSLRTLLLSLTLLSAAGCAHYVPLTAGTPTLTLPQATERSSRLGLKVNFPAGDYVADFANQDGIFYLAPSSVMFSNLGIHNPMRGGLFIPTAGAKDQRQSAWKQDLLVDTMGGLLAVGAPSIHLYPLDQPVLLTKKPANPESPVSPVRVSLL